MSDQSKRHHDVFLSYSHQDEQQVQSLAERLKAQGLDVWIAPYNIRVGTEFPHEIEEGLQSSQTVVTVLSPSSVQSFWVRQEWQGRLIQMSTDLTRRLIPVLLAECEIPLLLKPFRHIDFRNVDFVGDIPTFEDKIQELVNSIKNALPPLGVSDIPIPFAVIAMTRLDAEELITPGFLPADQQAIFEGLISTLNLKQPQDFPQRYGATPEEWKPFQGSDRTIRDFIEKVADWVNHTHATESKLVVRPQYYSQAFLSPEQVVRSQTWNHLEYVGCVLVIDSISMFHPKIRDLLMNSQLLANDRVALISVSPADARELQANQIIERATKAHMQRIFDRYDESLDPQCVINVGDERTFSRWLYAVLPKTVEVASVQRANPAKRKLLRNTVGQSPRGFNKLIWNQMSK